ncbi:Hydrolase phosphatase protein (plasmid) [Sodalis praecaptivus]|uniref:Hydrolase phosphatase protein n=1 Tax=Sodalis praecaptivus TaxID=1239307 RepID=W0I418_9GAMM|nr:HAD family hydrolase [Sodalis praecaptivus]AHF79215.1 Hydrolase phosphatase protein [Sodalis praecaptivus]
MNNRVDLIIFDCDGVLVDSEIIGIQLTIALLQEYGVDIGFDEFTREFSGLAWDDLLTKVQIEKGVDIPASISQRFYPLLMATFSEKLTRIAGTYEVISTILTPKCVCSNSSSEQLEFMLSRVGLKSLFSPHIFSAVDLGPGRAKPQPDIFLHAANVLNVLPENTLVVEDSVHGVTAAKKAGMYVIGFTGGAHTTPHHQARLTSAGADVVINAMSLLTEEIERYRLGAGKAIS